MSAQQTRTEECYVCDMAFPTSQGRYFRQYGELMGWACDDCLPKILPDQGDLPEPAPTPEAAPKVTYGNPNHTPWTEAEDAELRLIAAETYEGKRLRGWKDKPRGRYAVFAQHHGRTLAAVKMRAKRLGVKSYT